MAQRAREGSQKGRSAQCGINRPLQHRHTRCRKRINRVCGGGRVEEEERCSVVGGRRNSRYRGHQGEEGGRRLMKRLEGRIESRRET